MKKGTIFDAAREWLADLTFADAEPEEMLELSDRLARQAVERHYNGGWTAFMRAEKGETK